MSARNGALSPHFMLDEFAMDNGTMPPAKSVVALRRLCTEVLEVMRVQFGPCTITSGYRTVSHNKAVGGAPDSRHVYDKHPDSPAADVRFRTGTPEQWAALAIRMKVGGVGLYKGHVHVDMRPRRARW